MSARFERTPPHHERLHRGRRGAMEYVEHADPAPEPISIARCRELLGKDAESTTDQNIEDIRRHAEKMACIVVERYQAQCRASRLRGVLPPPGPCTDRLSECATVRGQRLGPRPGAGDARSASVRRVRDGPVHERTAPEPGQDLGLTKSPQKAAHVSGDRRSAAQPVVRGHRGPSRVWRSRQGDFAHSRVRGGSRLIASDVWRTRIQILISNTART